MAAPGDANLQDMPDCVLRAVFDLLAPHPGLASARRLQLAASCPRLDFFYRHEYVATLDLARRDFFRAADLARALNRLPRLRRIVLDGCEAVAQDVAAVFGPGMFASGTQTPNRGSCGSPEQRLPQLTYVSICRTNIDDDGVQAIVRACPELKTLMLNECCCITDDAIRALASSPAACKITRLHLRGTYVADIGPYLAQLVNITCLSLASCRQLHVSAFIALTSLGCIEELTLSGTNIADNIAIQVLPHLHSLQRLDLGCCRQLTSDVLTALPPALSTLYTFQTKILSGPLPADLSRTLPCLIDIRDGYNRQFTTLDVLAPLALQLRQLQLTAVAIGDESADALYEMRSLRSLKLGGCRAVSDRLARAAATLPELEHLELRGTAITDDGVRSLAGGDAARSLKCVDLRLCQDVLDDDGAVDELRSALSSKSSQVLF